MTDTERIDWLEKHLAFRNVVNFCIPGPQWECVHPNGPRVKYETAREAIDAAMQRRLEETDLVEPLGKPPSEEGESDAD
jgi:hypothetical protein